MALEICCFISPNRSTWEIEINLLFVPQSHRTCSACNNHQTHPSLQVSKRLSLLIAVQWGTTAWMLKMRLKCTVSNTFYPPSTHYGNHDRGSIRHNAEKGQWEAWCTQNEHESRWGDKIVRLGETDETGAGRYAVIEVYFIPELGVEPRKPKSQTLLCCQLVFTKANCKALLTDLQLDTERATVLYSNSFLHYSKSQTTLHHSS